MNSVSALFVFMSPTPSLIPLPPNTTHWSGAMLQNEEWSAALCTFRGVCKSDRIDRVRVDNEGL